MAKEIILVRHGKAASLDSFRRDIDRVLTERGVNDGYRIADRLVEEGILPELILTSPAARASHSAILLARAINADIDNIKIVKRFYHCSDETFLSEIYSLDDSINSVMIVAHNPGVTDLAYEFTRGETQFLPTTGVAIFKFDIDKWSKVSSSKPISHLILKPKEL